MAKSVWSNAAPLRRSIGEIKAKINWEAPPGKHHSIVFGSVLIRIGGKPFFGRKNSGPGQPPGPHCMWTSVALSPHHAVRRLSKPRSLRNARFWAHSPSRDLRTRSAFHDSQ